MIHRLSLHLSKYLIANGLPEQNQDIYVYGAECFFNLFLCDSILLCYAVLSHQIPEFFLWTVSFSILRSHIGGYHAPSHALCIVSSVLLGILCLTLYPSVSLHSLYILILLAFCFLFIIKFAPIVSPSHPLSNPLKKKEHFISIICFIIEYFVAEIFYQFHPAYSSIIIISILSASILSILGYIKYHTYQ